MTLLKERQTPVAHIRMVINASESPHAWIDDLSRSIRKSKHVLVARQLVGAMLERKGSVSEGLHPASAEPEEAGGLVLGNDVYYVALVPTRSVMESCAEAMRQGRHPMLLLPRKLIERGKGAASAIPDLEQRMSFVGIEDFLVMGVLTLAQEEGVSYLAIWESVVGLYNERAARLRGDGVPKIEMEIVGEGDGNEG